MAPHSSTLARKIPGVEEPGRLQSIGSRRVRHNWATSFSLFTFMNWRRKWQPIPVFLPEETQGAWWAAIYGVTKNRTLTERLHFHFSLSCIGEGNGSPFQCCCLENPRDNGAWWAAICGVAESDTTEAAQQQQQQHMWRWLPTPVFLPEQSHGWRSLVGCSPWGHKESDTYWATSLSLFTFMHWRRKWQPTLMFLPGESQGRWGLVGLPSMGSHRVGHDWSDLAAAAEPQLGRAGLYCCIICFVHLMIL